jgi:hypothetical protein
MREAGLVEFCFWGGEEKGVACDGLMRLRAMGDLRAAAWAMSAVVPSNRGTPDVFSLIWFDLL